jgi:hypothetical protein
VYKSGTFQFIPILNEQKFAKSKPKSSSNIITNSPLSKNPFEKRGMSPDLTLQSSSPNKNQKEFSIFPTPIY